MEIMTEQFVKRLANIAQEDNCTHRDLDRQQILVLLRVCKAMIKFATTIVAKTEFAKIERFYDVTDLENLLCALDKAQKEKQGYSINLEYINHLLTPLFDYIPPSDLALAIVQSFDEDFIREYQLTHLGESDEQGSLDGSFLHGLAV